MDMQGLRIFAAVVDQRGFGRGAEAAHVTQSAASQAIRKMEDELGTALLLRARPPQLTPAGRRLYEHARDLLARDAVVRRDVDALRKGGRGLVQLGASQALSRELLPRLVLAFHAAHPEVALHLETLPSREIIRVVAEGRLELGLGPFARSMAGLEVHPLGTQRMVLYAGAGSAATRARPRGKEEALRRLPLVTSHLETPGARPGAGSCATTSGPCGRSTASTSGWSWCGRRGGRLPAGIDGGGALLASPVDARGGRGLRRHRAPLRAVPCRAPVADGAGGGLSGDGPGPSVRARGGEMIIVTDRIAVATRGDTDIVDLTDQVAALVRRPGLAHGHALVFVPGSTAGITTIEYEPGLLRDIPAAFERLAPRAMRYHHEETWHDGNGHSHVRAALLGCSVTVPFEEGKLLLGTCSRSCSWTSTTARASAR